MDRGAWRATVHGVAKSWTRVHNAISLHFTSHPSGHVLLTGAASVCGVFITCLSLNKTFSFTITFTPDNSSRQVSLLLLSR